MADLVAIQINGGTSISTNLTKIEDLVTRASYASETCIVVIPECATLFACSGKDMLNASEKLDQGPVQERLSALANSANVVLVAGSMPIQVDESHKDISVSHRSNSKYYACSLVFDPHGKRIGIYNKMHLFDVSIEDATGVYQESKYTAQGKHLSVVDLAWARLGQSICYDLRFPALYAQMHYPEIIVVPSAFTQHTGQAHWHTLLRARAIENQAYVIAANQWGKHEDGRETFGHSCIYSPWGELLSVVEEGEGFAKTTFDKDLIEKVRNSIPVSKHTRF